MTLFTKQELLLLTLIDFGIEEYDELNYEMKEKLYHFFKDKMPDEIKELQDKDTEAWNIEHQDKDTEAWIIEHLSEIPGV